jgi:hypothetical protein
LIFCGNCPEILLNDLNERRLKEGDKARATKRYAMPTPLL